MVHDERNPPDPPTGRTSVERIAEALGVVAARGWISAADLAAELGVERSTGWRLARSLEKVGWLRHDPLTRRYRLGLPLFELGTRVLDTVDVRDEARRVMTELVASTGESVDFGVRDGDSIVFIDKIDGTNEVRAFTRAGQRARLHATAAGKVFLAAMSERDSAAYLAGRLDAYTPATVTDPGVLAAIIEETRRQGWAVNRGELFPEAGALAVPVRDAAGTTVAALGLNVPLSRLDDDRIRVLVAELLAATRRLSPAVGLGVGSAGVAARA
ncbi:MAG: IclR family transcriptional regulator [Candidatus Limnocylindria bacterium]